MRRCSDAYGEDADKRDVSSAPLHGSYDLSGPGTAIRRGRAARAWQRVRSAAAGSEAAYTVSLAVAGAVAVVFALRLCGQVEHAVFVWPVSGALFGLASPWWRRARTTTLLWSTVGVVLGCLGVGMPPWLALQTGALTAVDLCLAGYFLFPMVGRFSDLKRREGVVRFALCATLIPLGTTLLGAPTLSLVLHAPLSQTLLHSFLSNSLGITLTYPTVLLLLGRETGRRSYGHLLRRDALLGLAAFTAVAGWVFWQNSGPFLFVVFPPMIVVLLLGLEGAVLASLVVSVLGWVATMHGHGPVWLLHNSSADERLLILQLFVWICLVTALPVGALLDERQAAERNTEQARAIYQTMLQNSAEMIVLSSMDGAHRYVSPAVERITGWTPDEYLARNRGDLMHPDDRDLNTITLDSLRNGKWEHTVRYRLQHKAGDYRWVEATVRAYGDAAAGVVEGYVGAVRDISELQRTETRWEEERAALTLEQQRLANLASTDALTGLPNRRALEELLSNCQFDMQMQARHAARDGRSAMARRKLTVMMVDVDFFKLYNDTHGHAEGDACLAQLAAILQGALSRKDDVVTRLGGEEFAIVLPGAGHAAAQAIAERLLEAVRAVQRPHRTSPLGYVTVSIGIAVGEPAEDFSYVHLLQQADRALYYCKDAGKNMASLGMCALSVASGQP